MTATRFLLILNAFLWGRVAYVEITQDSIIRAFLRGLLTY
jgi:hypothetical protein